MSLKENFTRIKKARKVTPKATEILLEENFIQNKIKAVSKKFKFSVRHINLHQNLLIIMRKFQYLH